MIAGLLPLIASSFQISVGAAGQLVTAFSLAYAIGSPVLSATTGNVNRHILLILSLTGFSAMNLLAGLSTNYWILMLAHIGLALMAGLFMPAAVTFASVVVGLAWQGRAVALVTGGVTTAIALGAPLGTWIGTQAIIAFGIIMLFLPSPDLFNLFSLFKIQAQPLLIVQTIIRVIIAVYLYQFEYLVHQRLIAAGR